MQVVAFLDSPFTDSSAKKKNSATYCTVSLQGYGDYYNTTGSLTFDGVPTTHGLLVQGCEDVSKKLANHQYGNANNGNAKTYCHLPLSRVLAFRTYLLPWFDRVPNAECGLAIVHTNFVKLHFCDSGGHCRVIYGQVAKELRNCVLNRRLRIRIARGAARIASEFT